MTERQPLRVLLVEDDPDDHDIARELLQRSEQFDATLTWASSYERGLEFLQQQRFDVVLLDHRLGAKTGLDFLREPTTRHCGVPVVLLTGEGGDLDLSAATAGAVDYLSKETVTARNLERSLRFAVETRRRHRVERQFQALIEHSSDLVLSLRPDGTVGYASPALERVLGLDPACCTGRPLLELVHPDDRGHCDTMLQTLSRGEGIARLRCRMAHADGTFRTVEAVAQDLTADPFVGGVVINARDVTQLVSVEEDLRHRQAELQERVKELRCLYDVSKLLLEAPQALPATLRDVVARIPAAFRHPPSVSARLRLLGDQYASTGFRETEWRLTAEVRRAEEVVGHLDVCLTEPPPAEWDEPFLPEERDLVDALADRLGEALARRAVEERLARSEAHFRAVAERAGIVIGVVDAEGVVRYVSDEVRHAFGLSPEQLLDGPVFSIAASRQDEARARDLLAQAMAAPGTTHTASFSLKLGAGDVRHGEVTARSLLDEPAVRGVVVTLRDVTESHRAAERIHFQARLLDAVGQAVIATDLDGRVTYWNRAAEEMYGWTRPEAIGESIMVLTPAQPERTRAADIMAKLRGGDSWRGEFLVKRKDGSEFPALITNAPLRDEAGQRVGIVGVSIDISERKELQSQLLQAQKMEAIGRLAGGVAHDFNNLLTAIQGYVDLLLEDAPPARRADLAEIRSAAQRAADLTRQLLAFSRKQLLEERVIDLAQAVAQMHGMLRRLIPEDVRFEVSTGRIPITVKADPTQVQQVVMNLVVNAVDALGGGGSVQVSVDHCRLSEADVARIPWSVTAGAYARITVRDSGAGMPPEVKERMFEPFYTTKAVGKGTGLGLSTVFGIVKQSGGHIFVDSQPGAGTEIRVLFPVVDAAPSENPTPRGQTSSAPPGSETVLIVEDDPGVRRVATRFLKRAGHRVLVAENGSQALDIAKEYAKPIHVVLSDVVMPEMGGPELALRLREHHPQVRVVLTSGYSRDQLAPSLDALSATFLPKPFSNEQLMRAIRRAVNGASGDDGE